MSAITEGMQSYGWSLVDSNGAHASVLIFQNREAANKYRSDLSELNPGRNFDLVELFVKKRDD
jgi:hypothetical protein